MCVCVCVYVCVWRGEGGEGEIENGTYSLNAHLFLLILSQAIAAHAYEKGDAKAALDAYEDICQVIPKHADAFINKGTVQVCKYVGMNFIEITKCAHLCIHRKIDR